MIEKGNDVKAIKSCDGKSSIIYECGEVIYVNLRNRALVQFDNNVCGHNGNGLGKNRRCWMVDFNCLQ